MPRRNNRVTPPPTSKKALDHWMQMCRELTEQGQRTLNLEKRATEPHSDTVKKASLSQIAPR